MSHFPLDIGRPRDHFCKHNAYLNLHQNIRGNTKLTLMPLYKCYQTKKNNIYKYGSDARNFCSEKKHRGRDMTKQLLTVRCGTWFCSPLGMHSTLGFALSTVSWHDFWTTLRDAKHPGLCRGCHKSLRSSKHHVLAPDCSNQQLLDVTVCLWWRFS